MAYISVCFGNHEWEPRINSSFSFVGEHMLIHILMYDVIGRSMISVELELQMQAPRIAQQPDEIPSNHRAAHSSGGVYWGVART
mmetsp:Transcript_8763/g.15951  ORF Transcript_8763/g.15951 Transcript_8763/m.15951 type:complete len:84 (+) Transcript_8763:1567-1818(+)